ncbi:MarR family transcriptional regulator [Nocardia sp. CA-128927]|uniref:MarR family winged helix-turn-helix transcriptional regulator n=1 Tax=Nocardia sp. CA-128927 TaxID=3239975 RepID=UPI003D99527B
MAYRFTEQLARLDLDPAHFAVLGNLAAADGRSQQELADLLRVHRNAMVGLVDELEERPGDPAPASGRPSRTRGPPHRARTRSARGDPIRGRRTGIGNPRAPRRDRANPAPPAPSSHRRTRGPPRRNPPRSATTAPRPPRGTMSSRGCSLRSVTSVR